MHYQTIEAMWSNDNNKSGLKRSDCIQYDQLRNKNVNTLLNDILMKLYEMVLQAYMVAI